MQQPGNEVPAPCSHCSPPVQNKPSLLSHPQQQITLPSRPPPPPPRSARQARMPPRCHRGKKAELEQLSPQLGDALVTHHYNF